MILVEGEEWWRMCNLGASREGKTRLIRSQPAVITSILQYNTVPSFRL